MSSPSSSRPSRDEGSSSQSGEGSSSAATQRAPASHNHQGQRVNFPQALHVGRHADGDTDEISVIVCTQRARRRYAGELPRCYTFGWRHINHFEVPPAGKPSLMPPKFGQEREVPGYWKERVIGSLDHPTWEGDQDEDAEEAQRPLNYVEKREEWKEGNYVSYGTGSASAFEKIQGMHVPLHSYDAHRRIREDLWTAERIAANLAKHHAKALKHHMRAEEQRRKAEAAQSTIYSAGSSASTSTQTASVARSTSSTQLASTDQSQTSSSTAPSTSSAPSSPAVVKSKAVPVETKDTPQQKPSPPAPPPVDKRFAPENILHVPWYRRLWNYGPPPTGWTADERYGHRSYIIPHPLHALKDNLVRSWMVVLTPTWKLTKALTESFSSGAQRRFWLEMWTYSKDNRQYKLLSEANTLFKQKIAEEQEKQRQESIKQLEAVQSVMAESDKVINKLESLEKEGKLPLSLQQKAELAEMKKQRASQEEELRRYRAELDKTDKSRSTNGRNDRNGPSSS